MREFPQEESEQIGDPMIDQNSTHPSPKTIISWLYERELDPQIDDRWNDATIKVHLDRCSDCSELLRAFQSTRHQLDASFVPLPERENFGTSILSVIKTESSEGVNDSLSSQVELDSAGDFSKSNMQENAPKSAVQLLALVAGFIVIAGMSFLFGMRFQSETTRQSVQRQLDENFKKIELVLENRVSASEKVWKKKDFQKWIDKQISLTRSTDKQQSELAVRKALNDLSIQIDALLANQNAMKSDILTVAVNTDNEIKVAKNDILRIKQYVSQFLTSRP